MAQQHGGAPRESEDPETIDITPVPGFDSGEHPVFTDEPGDVAEDPAADDDGAAGGSATAAVTRKPSRGRVVLLGTALAVGLAGAVALGIAGARILGQKDATLTPPDSVAGLTVDNSEGATTTAESLRTALAAGIELDDTTAVVYSDPAAEGRSVLFFGGTALLFTPGSDLDAALELVGDQGKPPEDLREMPAGELGGVLKCGVVDVPGEPMAACGWADHGSVALALFPGRSPTEAGSLMVEIREATQTRS